jgi:hypothetical protein
MTAIITKGGTTGIASTETMMLEGTALIEMITEGLIEMKTGNVKTGTAVIEMTTSEGRTGIDETATGMTTEDSTGIMTGETEIVTIVEMIETTTGEGKSESGETLIKTLTVGTTMIETRTEGGRTETGTNATTIA